MKTKKPTRRERQAELLKKEILEAAVNVFKEYGFEKATTKRIAERAEVSEGTLYNYFENKRDILISLFKIIRKKTFNNISILPGNESDINKLLSTIMITQFNKNSIIPIFTLLLQEARLDPKVQKEFCEQNKAMRKSRIDFYKQLEKTGKVRKVNALTMAVLMSAIAIGYTTLIESGDEELAKIPVNKLANEITDILVNGLAAPAKKMDKVAFQKEFLKNQTLS